MPKQSSLRLMLAVLTALCIALSLWLVPVERQRRAVKAIEAGGGRVRYVWHSPQTSKSFLRRWLPQDYVDDVEEVLLDRRTRVTHDAVAQLEALPKLRYLWLADSRITDSGLLHLQGLTKLEKLGLNDTRVTDAGLMYLKRLTNLQILWLINTQVTEDGVARLRKELPKCEIFRSPSLS